MNNTYKTAAGGLTVTFAATDQGLFLAGLTDEVSSRTYLREIQPLFSLEYECLESGERATVSSADGWTVAAVDAGKDARQFILSGCAKLPDVIVTLTVRGGENGKLYGAVTNDQIAAALKEQFGIEIDKRKIEQEEPVRSAGQTAVTLKLMAGVSARVLLNVKVVTK